MAAACSRFAGQAPLEHVEFAGREGRKRTLTMPSEAGLRGGLRVVPRIPLMSPYLFAGAQAEEWRARLQHRPVRTVVPVGATSKRWRRHAT